eukprot:3702456-Prymnesium_polylepis.1
MGDRERVRSVPIVRCSGLRGGAGAAGRACQTVKPLFGRCARAHSRPTVDPEAHLGCFPHV